MSDAPLDVPALETALVELACGPNVRPERRAMVTDLARRLSELVRDGERLDWMEQNAHGVYCARQFPDGRIKLRALARSTEDSWQADTVREAMDAARSPALAAPTSPEK